MGVLKLQHYLKLRFNRFKIFDINLYALTALFLGLLLASFWPRTLEKLQWIWIAGFILTMFRPLLILLKKETLLEKIKFNK